MKFNRENYKEKVVDEYNRKTISFGNGNVEVVAYHHPQIRLLGSINHKGGANADSLVTDTAQEERTRKQSYAIKRRIRGYALSNSFKWFATLTIDPKKHNSLNYNTAKKILLKWCRKIRDRYGKFDYLIVPEFHKSKAIHFHALIGDIPAIFVEAQHSKSGKPILRNDRQVYNLADWEYGFTDCEEIVDSEKTASYMTKYITKELMTNKEMFRKKRYFNSQGLKKPKITFDMVETNDLNEFTPNFGIVDINKNGENYMVKSIYKLKMDSKTNELYQTDNTYLYKAKNLLSSPQKPQITDSSK